MTGCAAVGCQNREKDPPDLLWKYMPTKNKDVKELWLRNIKRSGDLPKERNIVLCSEHFSIGCFERNLKKEFETGSKTEIYKLKNDAIPTFFYLKKIRHLESHQSPVRNVQKKGNSLTRYVHCSSPSLPTFSMNTSDICIDEPCCSGYSSSSFIAAGASRSVDDVITVFSRDVSVMTDLSFNHDDDVSFSIINPTANISGPVKPMSDSTPDVNVSFSDNDVENTLDISDVDSGDTMIIFLIPLIIRKSRKTR